MTDIRRPILRRALALAVGTVLLAGAAAPCTLTVISGKAARNGRPLMWKNRDTSTLDNKLMSLRGPKYAFTAVVDAGDADGAEVWGGLNTAGFAIMNSQSDDLIDEARKGDGNANGSFMRRALGECATVRDFEALLARTKGTLDLAANFGVIDAEGAACFFETSRSGWQKFDADDPRVAPFGTLVRTNFAFTSPDPLKGGGFIRFERISHLVEAARGAGRLDARFILQEAARDLVHEKLHSAPMARPLPEDPAEPLYINTNDTINRNSSASAIVFVGAPTPGRADLATMWVVLGQPVAGVAVPVWPVAGTVPGPTAGAPTAPLCDLARAAVTYLYPDRRGRMPQYLSVTRLRTYGGEGLAAKRQRVEDAVLERTAAELAKWEKDRPAAAQVAAFQESVAAAAYEAWKAELRGIR